MKPEKGDKLRMHRDHQAGLYKKGDLATIHSALFLLGGYVLIEVDGKPVPTGLHVSQLKLVDGVWEVQAE